MLDLAVAVALGGDCLADIALLREQPGRVRPGGFGPDGVAADRRSGRRYVESAGGDRPCSRGRAAQRLEPCWQAGPDHGIDAAHPLVIDLDATLVTAHSDKENAAPTYKRGFGFHPLLAFVDHGGEGTGEPLGWLLRAGNAGSNTAADHIAVVRQCLRQLPMCARGGRVGRKVLIRADGAGGTHDFVDYLTEQKLSYSLGFSLSDDIVARLATIPASAWTPAYDADGEPRDGSWVAEATGVLALSGWPNGMRVIVRKQRPHPGAQLRFTDVDGLRLRRVRHQHHPRQLADLELRHRRRARCEDRIRTAKDTGLSNLPLHDFTQNQIWLALVALAVELTAWMQTLALTDQPARRWEPKRLRLRLFAIAGRIARHARRTHLRLSAHAPWRHLIKTALTRLAALPAPP